MMVCESWRSLEGRTNAPTRPGSVQRRTNRIRDSGEAVDATLALLPVLLAAIVVALCGGICGRSAVRSGDDDARRLDSNCFRPSFFCQASSKGSIGRGKAHRE